MSEPRSDDPPAAAALDVDGIWVVSLGTVAWAIALAFALAYEDHLRRDGHLWWLATAACGFGLGLVGIAYCVRRRRRLGAPQTRSSD